MSLSRQKALAFTLIELLVVIAIIAVLASLLNPALWSIARGDITLREVLRSLRHR